MKIDYEMCNFIPIRTKLLKKYMELFVNDEKH